MEIELNKTNLKLLITGFHKDKLAKTMRRRDGHGLDRFEGTFEARDGELHINSGRVKLTVRAVVNKPGSFTMRDATFRELLETLKDEPGIRLRATVDGLEINGACIGFGGSYRYRSTPLSDGQTTA